MWPLTYLPAAYICLIAVAHGVVLFSPLAHCFEVF